MMSARSTIRVLTVAWVILSVLPATADAERITVLCSNGLRTVIQDLAPEFERVSGHQVAISFSVGAELKKRIDAGEPFDLAILTPPLVDQLIEAGKVVRASRTAVARAPMALAVRAGSPRPDVRSVSALSAALVAAPSIAFAREGAGGVFFTALIQRLGLAERLAATLKPLTTGQDVSRAVANGDAALGVLPLSEILSVAGIEVGGQFPADVQDYAVMVGAVSAQAAHGAAAESLLRFLMAPSADQAVVKRGMERVPR